MSDDVADLHVAYSHVRQAEVDVLAGGFASKVTRERIRQIIQPGDFESPSHEAAWRALATLDGAGEAVTPASVVAALAHHAGAQSLIPELARVVPEHEATTAAKIVRAASRKRQVATLVTRFSQRIIAPSATADHLLVELVNEATVLRDQGISGEEDTSISLRELLDREDEPYDWLIPGLLERGDRFMLTGEEGLGKSMLLRQIGVCVAAGLHPFGGGRIKPHNVLLYDVENSERQIRRAMRSMTGQLVNQTRGMRDPRDHFQIERTHRVDITDDMVLSRIHRLIDKHDPSVVIIGPLYRLTPRAIQTDDEAAPVLAALDTIKDRGIALLIEAHAGNGRGGEGSRDMRPRGSAALRGWPEFGYGMRWGDQPRTAKLERWRGDRDERSWPSEIEQGGVLPWSLSEGEKIRATETQGASAHDFFPKPHVPHLRPVD